MFTGGGEKVMIVVEVQKKRRRYESRAGLGETKKRQRNHTHGHLTLPVVEKVQIEQIPQSAPLEYDRQRHQINVGHTHDHAHYRADPRKSVQINVDILQVLLKHITRKQYAQASHPAY